MARQGPCVVQGQNNGQLMTELWKVPEIKITSVEIMTVDHVRLLGGQVQDSWRRGKVKILSALLDI